MQLTSGSLWKKFGIRLSIPLIGINWGHTANPILAVPIEGRLEIRVAEAPGSLLLIDSYPSRVAGFEEVFKSYLSNLHSLFNELTADGKGMRIKVTLTDAEGYVPLISILIQSVTLTAYILLKNAGYETNVEDILQLLELVWKKLGLEDSKQNLYNSMVISSLKKTPILYRDRNEWILLNKKIFPQPRSGSLKNIAADRTGLIGSETLSAIIKLGGSSTIEAASKVSSGSEDWEELFSALSPFFSIDNALTYILYALDPPESQGCKYINSLPGAMEVICF